MLTSQIEIDLALDDIPEPPINDVPEDLQDVSMGFRFDMRGPVPLTEGIQGEADFYFDGERLRPTNNRGAIMMLPEGTDIFTLNPQNLINTYSMADILLNPFDPNAADIGSVEDLDRVLPLCRDGHTW